MVVAVATIIVAADATDAAQVVRLTAVADATDAAQAVRLTVDAVVAADADADAVVKSAAGGSSGKIKIVAAENVVIAAAINLTNTTTTIMPLKDRLWVHDENLSLCALCLSIGKLIDLKNTCLPINIAESDIVFFKYGYRIKV